MRKVIVIFCTLISLCSLVYATDSEILESQQESLGISEFINASKKYTSETFKDLDIQNIFQDAITGRIGNTKIFNNLLNILNYIRDIKISYHKK